jgi:pimeloyl-ACP methyl ester carboxylesterase
VSAPSPDGPAHAAGEPLAPRRRRLTVAVSGRELRIVVRPGSDTAVPLLMCSGLGAGLEVFDPLVDALDPTIPVVRVDMPNVGGSPATALPLGMPQLARLLVGVLDRLGLDRVDVLGHSWGGALAQQFAAQHPDRCRRLVLVATSTGALSVPDTSGTWPS